MAYTDRNKKKKLAVLNDKVKVCLPTSVIAKLIQYSLSINDLITESNLVNLQKYIKSIDIERSYDSEKELPTIQMIKLLLKILYYNIEYTADDLDDLQTVIMANTKESEIPRETIKSHFNYMREHGSFDEKTILHYNKFIQNQLDLFAISKETGNIREILEAVEHPDPDTIETIIPVAKETFIKLNREFNMNTMDNETKLNSFNIADRSNAVKVIKQSLEAIYNPGNRISTGYQLLDRMIGGGLQGERVYLLLGVAKSFKSGTLLNIAMNVATLYCDYQLKDPDKIPAVLYLTMENSMIETFERIYEYLGLKFDFKYTTEKNKMGKTIKKYLISDKDVESILDTIAAETYDRTGIALRIEFRSHRTIDTGELDKFYENYLLNDGQELIFVVQDYVKRIRSQISYSSDRNRDEYGEIINEFGNFAKKRNIPVLTASQMNRNALKVIEDGKSKAKRDLGRKIGASQIGESSLMYENADYSIIINREEVEGETENDKTYFQSFKCVMARGVSGVEYFAQPYDTNPAHKNFKIATDTNLKEPLGVERIEEGPDRELTTVIENSVNALKPIGVGSRASLTQITGELEDQSLEFGDDD